MKLRRARVDRGLTARLHAPQALRYADGGSPADDRSPHVRAASAVRIQGARLVIVQDDAHVLALHENGHSVGLLLPAADGVRVFETRRGNKHRKLDLEAAVVLPDGRFAAFGSGSTDARERIVLLDAAGTVRIVDASALYATLRAELEFAGSELNIEGAVITDDALRLFQRGNGAPRDGLLPVNATCDLALDALLAFLDQAYAPPEPRDVVQYDLGHIANRPYGFTDATRMRDGRIAFVAAVEASPDAVRDGAVLGCMFGVIDGDDVRVTEVLDEALRPSVLKLEGIECMPDVPNTFHVVADLDDPDAPAWLLRLTLEEGHRS